MQKRFLTVLKTENKKNIVRRIHQRVDVKGTNCTADLRVYIEYIIYRIYKHIFAGFTFVLV